MWQQYVNFVSSKSVLLLSFILTCSITFGLFKTLPNLEALYIDQLFDYDRSEVLQILEKIGPEGRATYRWANWVDTVFPLVYGSFFVGFLYHIAPQPKFLKYIPVALAVVDIVETVQIGLMIRAYPAIGLHQAEVASGFTSIKQILLAVTLLVMFVFGGVATWRVSSRS